MMFSSSIHLSAKDKISFFFVAQSRGLVIVGGGEDVGKECRRVNIVQILCIQVHKWKMIPIETVPEMGGNKGEWWTG
jgi:hypothetical protein